ncbi:DegT/DnrJ/EryC1/StrS family aminotransferase [Candidatus Kaiserbacteria bacterium]|nr:DegT/DnrJ/EryC1/StrS family aminotransferase [Candidatus Kaiserbacteria bacterium]
MRKDFLSFGSPLIEEAEIEEVVKTLRSGWVSTGPKTHQFEEDFRKYIGAKYAVAVNSCTAAMHLALLAIGAGKGDEVIVPAMTFASTGNVIVHCGATPVFVDCDKATMNIDPRDVERKITSRTKAIMVVHMAGRPCDMDVTVSLAKKHSLKVIEDAAHAVETEYKGKKVGTLGDIGCYSFYATKNVVTGEGGMVVTNNEEYAKHIRILALHGMNKFAWNRYGNEGYKHYEFVEAGYKYNMSDIQASLGIHQLARIEKNWKRREEIWKKYDEALKDLPIILPAPVAKGDRHAYHLYTVLLDDSRTKVTRDKFLEEMTKRNIGCGVHFYALHLQPVYQKLLGHKEGDLPNTEWIGAHTASIPLSAKLSDDDVRDVVEAMRNLFHG